MQELQRCVAACVELECQCSEPNLDPTNMLKLLRGHESNIVPLVRLTCNIKVPAVDIDILPSEKISHDILVRYSRSVAFSPVQSCSVLFNTVLKFSDPFRSMVVMGTWVVPPMLVHSNESIT